MFEIFFCFLEKWEDSFTFFLFVSAEDICVFYQDTR